MKYDIFDIGGDVVKDNETYILKDNTLLEKLTVSSTRLHPSKSTRGHTHAGQEEVYFFVSGSGKIELDGDVYDVEQNSMILIKDGVYHRVYNTSETEELYFVCVFDSRRNH